MSLHPRTPYDVPPETARVAHACFPQGHPSMLLRDELGTICCDQDFGDLFPTRGQPATAPGRFALGTLLPCAERLPDRQAADAVRRRIDWQYLLGLDRTDPGFDHTMLSAFRGRLVQHEAGSRLFDLLLARLTALGLIKARGRQRSDSTQVLGAMRALNRLELVGEARRAALNALAVAAPRWLRAQAQPDWLARYGRALSMTTCPRAQPSSRPWPTPSELLGGALRHAIYSPAAPAYLRTLSAMEILRQVGRQNDLMEDHGRRRWRENQNMPPAAQLVSSPYDITGCGF